MLSLVLLFSTLFTFSIASGGKLKPGKYHINSHWGDICAEPGTGKLVVCPEGESTVWTYACTAAGDCSLLTDEGALQRRSSAPIELVGAEDSDGSYTTHISLGRDSNYPYNLFLDSDRYETKMITAFRKRNFFQQRFVFKPVKPMVSPGKYFIRSQWGLVCANGAGQFLHCSVHGLEPQEWEIAFSDGQYYLKNGSRWLKGSIVEDIFEIDFGQKSESTAVAFEDGSAPLAGDKTVKIRLSENIYLDSDRYDPMHMQPWSAKPFSQQDFVLVPAHKAEGMKTGFADLVAASHKFQENIREFPVLANSVERLASEVDGSELARDAEKAEIFMDASTYDLIGKFLAHKKAHGNAVERAVYAGIKDTDAFIDRLIQKRPLAFLTAHEQTLCPGPAEGSEYMAAEWALVGQVDPSGNSIEGTLKMRDYMTYEEMELAALVNVCTATRFINDGNRHNNGAHRLHPPMPGYFLAGVGARFEIPGRMEFRHMALKNGQAVPTELSRDPLSKMWQQFYGITKVQGKDEYEGSRVKLHIPTYKVRMAKTLKPILKQADRLGEQHGRKAVLRLVGFGLGVWAIAGVDQQTHFIQVVKDLLASNSFENINRVDMLWMGRVGTTEVVNGIPMVFSQQNPADPVGHDEVLVATYAWDGNSFPGNEYWLGMLSDSGDPAAAACSTIQEMQNPLINKCLTASNNLALYA